MCIRDSNAYGASCMTPLAPGKTCRVQVTFIPAAIKAYSETVMFQPQSSGCGGCTRNYLAQTFPVTGTGIAQPPVMKVTPATLAFGSQAVSTSSAVQSVTLTNSSTTDSVMMSTIQVTGSPFTLQPSSDVYKRQTLYVSNYVNLDIFDRFTTETVDFGEVDAGSSQTNSTASVYNGGNQPLTIDVYKRQVVF